MRLVTTHSGSGNSSNRTSSSSCASPFSGRSARPSIQYNAPKTKRKIFKHMRDRLSQESKISYLSPFGSRQVTPRNSCTSRLENFVYLWLMNHFAVNCLIFYGWASMQPIFTLIAISAKSIIGTKLTLTAKLNLDRYFDLTCITFKTLWCLKPHIWTSFYSRIYLES